MHKTYTRREILRNTGLLAAGIATGLAMRPARAADKPNILYIMADDHAAHAMSCYGSRINKTPNLDRIANEGMRLDNCFCTNSLCAPSRAAILTGKYSHINGLKSNKDKFDGSQQTFPKLLQKAGYQTAMIGKWHLKTDPTGFDYWHVLPGQGQYFDPIMIEMGEKKKHEGYVTDLITNFTIDFIKNRNAGKPFCVMCQQKAPHRAWFPDDAHAHMYDDIDIPTPETFDDDYSTRGAAAHTAEMTIDKHLTPKDLKNDPPEGLSPAELKHWKFQRYMQDYLGCIASVDDNVGRLLDFLDSSGLAENTIVVYTSDQGFFLGDHNWFDKRFMYEESLRMPFIVRYPKQIKAGTINDDIILNVDFGPTFLDYAGLETPGDMQGRSFRSILSGKTPGDWRTAMYYQYYEFPGAHSVRKHYGVRTKRYKLIHFYDDLDEWEFYDLEKDPHELKNGYDNPAYADTVAELKTELARLRKELNVPEE